MRYHVTKTLPFSPFTIVMYLTSVLLLVALGISQHVAAIAYAVESTDRTASRSAVVIERTQPSDRTDRNNCSDCGPEEPEPQEDRTEPAEPDRPTPEDSEEETEDTTPPTEPVAPQKTSVTQLTLKELGVLQLAAHDLFNMDRDTETDSENGKLDLSTLLDYGEENITLGGEPRNRENIILFTVAKAYGEKYVHYVANGKSEDIAYEKVLRQYHRDLERVYAKLFNEHLPKPKSDAATMTENLALRTIHDFLPGTITVGGETFLTVDHALVGEELSDQELKALTSPLDGQLDEEFLDVVIFIPPDIIMHISLLERDSSFGEQFNTTHSFEHFMSELEDGSYDQNDNVTSFIKSLFAKGLYLN